MTEILNITESADKREETGIMDRLSRQNGHNEVKQHKDKTKLRKSTLP